MMEFMNSGKKYSGQGEKYSGQGEMLSVKSSHDGHLQPLEKVMFFHVLTWGIAGAVLKTSAAIQKEDRHG